MAIRSIEAADYRRIIGQFATGVTVLTTANDGLLHGMTANAITSVSLDPPLLLVFCQDVHREAVGLHELLVGVGCLVDAD